MSARQAAWINYRELMDVDNDKYCLNLEGRENVSESVDHEPISPKLRIMLKIDGRA
jgi:hypothetical protein